MARITVEDCLKRVPSRFLLVNMVARRVRQIREGSEYLVSSPKNEDIVVALREIAAGKLTVKLKKKKGPQALPGVVESITPKADPAELEDVPEAEAATEIALPADPEGEVETADIEGAAEIDEAEEGASEGKPAGEPENGSLA